MAQQQPAIGAQSVDDRSQYLEFGGGVEVDDDVAQEDDIKIAQLRRQRHQVDLYEIDTVAQKFFDQQMSAEFALTAQTIFLQKFRRHAAHTLQWKQAALGAGQNAHADIRRDNLP